jgi:hypothetical protein
MTNTQLNVDKQSPQSWQEWLKMLLSGPDDSILSLAHIKDKQPQDEIGMTSINAREVKLLKDIAELEEQSWSLRDQIDMLERQEAKISEAINVKKRQLDTIKLMNIERK